MANSLLQPAKIAKKPLKVKRLAGMPKAMKLAKGSGPKGPGAKVFAKGYKL